MSKGERVFKLTSHADRLLATLSRIYKDRGEERTRRIIVNSKVRVQEDSEGEFDYSSNETFYGHSVFLDVPEDLYPSSSAERTDLQGQIKNDLNEICHIQNEYITAVFLEMEAEEDHDWRSESGLLLPGERTVTSTTAQRIWGSTGYRVFLSHKVEVKKKAAPLKERLALFGVSAFVAHTDIHPTKEWQEEIENALASMDAFVALLTDNFHESNWTDQEVGYALARGVPLIAVKLGRSPYGFIGRFQALSCTWDDAPLKLVRLLIVDSRMLDSFIAATSSCGSFDDGNTLSQILPHIKQLTLKQANTLVAAFNKNTQLRGSYGFNGEKPWGYGDGLAAHLSRITGERFIGSQSGEIKKAKK